MLSIVRFFCAFIFLLLTSYLLTIHYYAEPKFFIAPTKSYRKIIVENSKGVTQSQITAFIFLNNDQHLLAGSQQWGNAHFFHGFSSFCSISFVFLTLTLQSRISWGAIPPFGQPCWGKDHKQFIFSIFT